MAVESRGDGANNMIGSLYLIRWLKEWTDRLLGLRTDPGHSVRGSNSLWIPGKRIGMEANNAGTTR